MLIRDREASKLGWAEIPEGAMSSDLIVSLAVAVMEKPGLGERGEHLSIQELVSQSRVKRLALSVLPGLSGQSGPTVMEWNSSTVDERLPFTRNVRRPSKTNTRGGLMLDQVAQVGTSHRKTWGGRPWRRLRLSTGRPHLVGPLRVHCTSHQRRSFVSRPWHRSSLVIP